MKKRKIILLVFIATVAILLVISACHAQPEGTALVPSLSPTVALTNTPIKKPTRTPNPTKTVTLTLSATTDPKDFDASTIKTVTSAAPVQCNAVRPEIQITPQNLVLIDNQFEQPYVYGLNINSIVNYLNDGVSFETIFKTIQENKDYNHLLYGYYFEDVTGDSVEEYIFPNNFGVSIIGCNGDKYEHLSFLSPDNALMSIHDLQIVDANNDNLNDIGIVFSGCLMGSCPTFKLFTWNGTDFVKLTDYDCSTTSQDPFTVAFGDTDHNGTLEIIIHHNKIKDYIPDLSVLPDRDQTLVCMWNGKKFIGTEFYYGEPILRIEAYNDAIHRVNAKEYEEALELYQRVIHDETLQWYIPAERIQLQWLIKMEQAFESNPAIENDSMYSREFKQDIYEYPLLASASYYRMMLIYLQQGNIKNAETMLVILKDAYGPGKTGEHITEIAEIVLENYKETNDLRQSCPEAVAYLDDNWEIFTGDLTYLRLTDFFWGPQHWCPYLPEGYGEE